MDDDLYGKQALDTVVEKVNITISMNIIISITIIIISINTIKVTGAAGEDLAVVMIGYDAQMREMLRKQNPGLSRRFNPSYAFNFEDFSDAELLAIIGLRCRCVTA